MTNDSNPGSADGLQQMLSLGVPADPEKIGTTTDAVLACLAKLKIDEEKRLAIGLAVQEALANAVVHGCGGDASKTVHCELSSDTAGRVLIVVSDPGPGFDVSTLQPQVAENVYNDHGRGVFLIRELMDEVKFERNGSVIRMWKY
jgi:serine/threonine-protein kinase RsbW